MSNLKKIKVNNFILNNIILGIFIYILAYNLANRLNIFKPKIIEGNTDSTLSTIISSYQNQAIQVSQLTADVSVLQNDISNLQTQIQAQAQAQAQTQT